MWKPPSGMFLLLLTYSLGGNVDKPMVAVGEIMKGDESSFLLPKDTKLCPCSSVRRSLKVVNQSNSNIYDTKRSNLKYLLGHLLQFLCVCVCVCVCVSFSRGLLFAMKASRRAHMFTVNIPFHASTRSWRISTVG